MFRSAPAKVVFVLLIILGFMQFTAKKTVEKQRQHSALVAEKVQQQYNERVQQYNVTKQNTSNNLNAEREIHHLLTRLERPLSTIRNSVIWYKRKHDKWPEDMTDLGLNSEKAADGKYIQSIKIDNGEIYAFLTEKYGAKKIVRLYDDPGGFTWKCDINLPLNKKTTIASSLCSEVSNISFNGRYIQ
ncbi:MAG: hypothetical protein OEM07_04015 [Gammaproteobacteria bacterium]|nr:hypothetical protein [Gammaproteobacteria bacterium]